MKKIDKSGIKKSKEKMVLTAFNHPNGLQLATYLFYGLINIDVRCQTCFRCTLGIKDIQQNIHHILNDIKPMMIMRKHLELRFFSKNYDYNDFYFIYDRNPNIISNLIKSCKTFYYYPKTKFISLDKCNADEIDSFLIDKLHTTDIFNDVIFYSKKLIKMSVPQISHSKQHKITNGHFFHFLTMAIGVQNNNYCLFINSLKKSYRFCNGDITENNISNYLSDFCPYILIYQWHHLSEESIEISVKNYKCYKPNPLSLESSDDYYDSRRFVQDRYNKLMKKEYTFDKYLVLCLKYPSAFVAGTDYSFEKFGYMITVLSTSDYSTKEMILDKCEDEELKKGGRKLSIYYQKFMTFLRFVCLLINSFLSKDRNNFITAAKKSFSILPVANSFIASAFIDFVKLLTEKFTLKVDKKEKDLIHNEINKFLKCVIDDGSEKDPFFRQAFNLSNNYEKLPTINVYQAHKEVKECFKKLIDEIGDDYKSTVRKINLKDHDKTKDYEFYQKIDESILATYSTYNDIL